jgi:phenylacetate-CoA ligase
MAKQSILLRYLNTNHDIYIGKLLRDEEKLKTLGERKSLKLFHQATERIPAYKRFLKKHKIKPQLIKNIKDYKNVPYTSKENYIKKYKLVNRCWDANITNTHMVALSSGSTGIPTFWPRNLQQEIDGAYIHELILNKVFAINKNRTLFVNSFGLGNWIAGIYTEMCLYLTKLKGSDFTLASPGFSEKETFKVIEELSSHYDQTVISCHPPVLKMLIENGKKLGILWRKLNVKFLGAGEGFSENWRDYLLSLVGQSNPFNSFINILGSADAGLMGFETPLTIVIRRKTTTDNKLNQAVFATDRNPYLYQFDPRLKFIESVNGELTITADATMPLIRYNIEDHGYVLSYRKFRSSLENLGLSLKNLLKTNKLSGFDWHLPFVYMFGRKHFMLTLNAVNIYPENIKAALEHKNLQPYISGRYIALKKYNQAQDQYLLLRVELRPDIKPTKKLKKKIQNIFVHTLKKLNSEYNEVVKNLGEKMYPTIKVHRYHHSKYFPEGKIQKMT